MRQSVQQLGSFDLPGCMSVQNVLQIRFLFGRHAPIVAETVSRHFAKVALPFAAWVLLNALIAEALWVKGRRAVVTDYRSIRGFLSVRVAQLLADGARKTFDLLGDDFSVLRLLDSDLLIVSHSKGLRQHQHRYRDGHESKIVEADVHFARLVSSHSSFLVHVQENLHLLHIY